jgi:hypothetical protein
MLSMTAVSFANSPDSIPTIRAASPDGAMATPAISKRGQWAEK